MKKNKTTQAMASVLLLVFIGVFLVLLGRFLFIQASGEVAGVNLEEYAKEKRTASYTLEAERGKILDRNGMELAYDQPTYSIYAIVDPDYSSDPDNPLHVEDVDKTADELAGILDIDAADIKETLQNGVDEDKFQVMFGSAGSGLSQDEKKSIEELDLPGINFTEEAERFYPNGMFASQVIGLAQRSEDVIEGLTGIEQQMNDVLSGTNGTISYERDSYGVKLLQPNENVQAAEDGDDVYLTIDQKIQTLLEDTMSEVAAEYNPKKVSAIVMDPKTGEILAMSNRPSYDPNNPENVENWYNDAISNPFEPGSTMKIFTLASAIEEGVWNPDEEYESGTYQVDSETEIHDYNRSWGSISYLEGIQRSSNVAVANLAENKIGFDKFYDYLSAFHFDQKTGIDIPGEIAGTILYNYKSEKISTSYGQGTTATPIQMISAATAIANDGQMVTPHVIDKIVDPDTGEVVTQKETETAGQPISKETADETLRILESVVTSEHGTGQPYKLDDYTVAGKTGTAQIPDSETGRYKSGSAGNYVFSFLGMAPADDPELVMYVSVQEPELDEGESGSDPVSFIFNNVMENALHYLDINPDKSNAEDDVNAVEVPDIDGMSAAEAKDALSEAGFDVTLIGDGDKVVDTSIEGEDMLPGERILLLTDTPKMPNIKGWSVRDVLKLSELLELDMETIDSGYATTQSIKKGETIAKGDYLAVEFALD